MSGAGAQLQASLTLKGDSSGLTAAATEGSAALDRLKASVASASAAGGAMAAPYNAASVAIAGQAAASNEATKALTASGAAKVDEIARLTELASASSATTEGIVALSAAHSQYNSTVNAARQLLASGVITQVEYEQAVKGASAQLALATAVHKQNTQALTSERGGTAALSEAQKQLGEAAAEGSEKIEGLAHGVEHVGEAAGIGLGSMRLMVDAVKDIAAAAFTAEGAAILLGVGLAAAAIAAVVASQSYESSIVRINDSVIANANSLHLSQQGYLDLAKQIAATANVSESSAETILEALQGAGVNSQNVMLDLASASRAYAAATGGDATKAAEGFASSLKDPIAWSKQLTDQFGLFNAAQLQTIQNLTNSGHAMQANDLIAQAIIGRMKDAEDQTTAWGGLWDDLTKHMSDYWKAFGQYVDTAQRLPPLSMGSPSTQPEPSAYTNTPSQDNTEQLNQESAAVQNLIKQYDTFGTTLQTLSEQSKQVSKAEADGAIGAATAETALHDIELKRAETLKAQHDALLNLNEVEKMHEEMVKDLAEKTGPEAVKQAQADAAALNAQAAATDGTAESIKALQDQYAIVKATLPYVTALQWAHGAAADKLRQIIEKLTASLKEQQSAQEQLNTIQQVATKFAGMSSIQDSNIRSPTTDAAFVAQTSTQIFNANAAAEIEWKNQSIATLDAWLNAQDTVSQETLQKWQDWRDQVGLIFNSDMAKFYQEDLARRTDWASGVERGLDTLTKDTGNWAKTSESLVTGFSNEFEDDLAKMVATGQDTLTDFFQWIVEQLVKLAYQQYLANSFNSLFGSIVSAIGDAIGAGSGAVTSTAGTGSGTIGVGIHHAGGTAGEPQVTRQVPMALFADARRHHSGTPYLRANEVPIIAEEGERIYTEAQATAIDAALSRPIVLQAPANSNSAPGVTVNVHPAPGTTAQVQQNGRGPDGSFSLDVFVTQIDKGLAQKSKLGRSAFTQSLENTHGIRRSPQG